MNKLYYNTRDKESNDIFKEVIIKKFPKEEKKFTCMCGKECCTGTSIKKIVSSNFTEWSYVSEYVCEECSDMFTLFKYSYIKDFESIRLLNIREMAEEIQKIQKPPFSIIISMSQKKHLFYKSKTNYDSNNFNVLLESEQISCELMKLKEQFKFVSSMQALGESKERLKSGEIRGDLLLKVGYPAFKYLKKQLMTRQIQIPLFLSQKADISEEYALVNIKEICE